MGDKAILFGINNYLGISDLRGCLNDVGNVRRLLLEEYGFAAQQIRTFEDAQVTKAEVKEQWKWLCADAEPGDRLVFHFSGHGSYVESHDDDEPIDEILCLYDMNFDDENSYLIDDELGKMTKQVPQGAMLTIILDCCHSGTGTRSFTQHTRTGEPLFLVQPTVRSLAAHVSSLRSAKALVGASEELRELAKEHREFAQLARMVHPPKHIRKLYEDAAIKRVGRSVKQSLNHQLLAGAADDQTAADAYIDGDYHGAFSYYLCQNARGLGAQATTDTIFAELKADLKQNHYQQIPQNEGPFGHIRLFGVRDKASTSTASTKDGELGTLLEALAKPGSRAGEREVLLQQMLQVAEKFLDLAHHVAGVPASPQSPAVRLERGSDECIVYVHGIGKHERGYSDKWYESVKPYIHLPKAEVHWSDIVNKGKRSTELVPPDEQAARDALRRELELVLNARQEQHESLVKTSQGRAVTQDRGGGIQIDDFVRYMTNTKEREAILSRFYDVVKPLLEKKQRLHIVSHSWGTVVAWEGLYHLAKSGVSGRVGTLFTCGSALSIGPVRHNLFQRIQRDYRPDLIERAINLDAAGDVVGGSIKKYFAVEAEFLGLKPVGCSEVPVFNVAWSPACAHSSYFVADNVEVNRDIFAAYMGT